jgi:HYR domain
VLVASGAAASAATPAHAPSSSRPLAPAETGTLAFKAEVSVSYPPQACPGGSPNSLTCFARTGSTGIRGLGDATKAYPYSVETGPAGCGADQVRVLPASVRLDVRGKGAIELRVGGTGCLTRVPPEPLRAEETFAVTGGTGRYAGASGGGTIAHVSSGPPRWRGTDTWTGTIVVAGLDFDLTPPTLTGAAGTTVRAPRGQKRVRVRYAVTAQDDVDGAVPATCKPRSGSWFSVGRTRVRCSATDTSANDSGATFVVTVKRT